MIIDEQTLFREGIKAILEQTDAYQVIASLENTEQAIEKLEHGEEIPNIILINLELPDMQAIQFMKYVKQRPPETKVIILVEALNQDKLISAILAGADGFFMKNHCSEKLLYTIKDVQDGETVIPGPIAKMLASYIRNLTMDHKEVFALRLEKSGYYFTNRELDVAYLLKNNHTNQEIAKKLHLGEGTVKNYISEIYNKLNLRIRKQVIHFLQDLME